MKKRIIRSLCSKGLAAAVGAAVLLQAQAPVLAGALDSPLYISEVFLSYGETDDKAKQWLKDNGYEILDQNLNEDAEGGVSWLGLASTKRSVYLGYKTTTDEDKAIRDMRAMNMNGSYSYEEYEKVLENKKAEINAFISGMKTALAEYRKNYEKGSVKAKIAHDKLNQLTDDDSNYAGLGDLLLKPIREEISEKKYSVVPEEHVDMTTLLMQGNTELVNAMMSDLSMALDTADDSWLTRLKNTEGTEGLIERYEKQYPALPESKIDALIRSDYDDLAKELAEKLTYLRNDLRIYTESSINADSSDEEVNEYFKLHTDVSVTDWTLAGVEYQILNETKFDNISLADIISEEKYDFDDAEGRTVLYPIIDAMSEGQRALLSYVSFGEMLISGNLDADGWKSTADETANALKDSKSDSIYSGVDRSMFDPAGVALTSEARKIQSSTGSGYTNTLLGVETSYIKYAGIGATALFLGAGIGSFIRSSGLRSAAKAAKDLADEARRLNSLAEAQKSKLADAFYKYLLKDKVVSLDAIPVVDPTAVNFKPENVLKIYDDITTQAKKGGGFVKANNENLITFPAADEYFEKFKADKELLDSLDLDFDKVNEEYQTTLNRIRVFDTDKKIKHADEISNKFVPWKTAGKVLCIAAALIAIGTAAVEIYDIYKYYHQEYAPIPRMIVHENSDDKGRFVYTSYNCALCNRETQGFGNDKLGAYGDMNGDVGKQWLALYTTTDKAAGDPITADIIAQKGSNKAPADKTTGIRLFGKSDTVNIVSKEYGYNDALGGLYIFSGTAKTDAKKPVKNDTDSSETDASSKAADSSAAAEDTSSAAAAAEDTSSGSENKTAGSVVGTGVMVGSCVGSAALGALICFLLVRRKKSGAAV